MKNESELKRTNHDRNNTVVTHTGPVQELHQTRPVNMTFMKLFDHYPKLIAKHANQTP